MLHSMQLQRVGNDFAAEQEKSLMNCISVLSVPKVQTLRLDKEFTCIIGFLFSSPGKLL